jgi:hypothetical protein
MAAAAEFIAGPEARDPLERCAAALEGILRQLTKRQPPRLSPAEWDEQCEVEADIEEAAERARREEPWQ